MKDFGPELEDFRAVFIRLVLLLFVLDAACAYISCQLVWLAACRICKYSRQYATEQHEKPCAVSYDNSYML